VPLRERTTNVEELRSWTDKIPLSYQYTAGVAGEKFLRGLQEGKILAAACDDCGRRYLPPKTYCVECFAPIDRYTVVGRAGVVSALTESHVDFEGRELQKPLLLAFVTFKGVNGGLIHKVEGRRVRIGSRVVPEFAPQSKRRGSLLDILRFVPA